MQTVSIIRMKIFCRVVEEIMLRNTLLIYQTVGDLQWSICTTFLAADKVNFCICPIG